MRDTSFSKLALIILGLAVFLTAGTLVNTAVGSPLPLPTPFASLAAIPAGPLAPTLQPAVASPAAAPSLPKWTGQPAISIWETYEATAAGLRFDHPANWVVETGEDGAATIRNYADAGAPVGPEQVLVQIERLPEAADYRSLDVWVAERPLFDGPLDASEVKMFFVAGKPARRWSVTGPQVSGGAALVALQDGDDILLVTVRPLRQPHGTAVNALIDSLHLSP